MVSTYRTLVYLAFILTIVACVPARPAGAASFTPLGDLADGTFDSGALGISADGSIVVGFGHSASGLEPFRWTSGSGMVGLGELAGSSFDGLARNISANGSVIVGQEPSTAHNPWPEAFQWTAPGPMVGLGDIPGNANYSQGWDASVDGSVIVGVTQSTASGPGYEAFRWTSGGGMVGLGDLPGGNIPGGFGSFFSRARSISDDGLVIVGEAASTASTGSWEAFRWTSGGMVGLGDLPGAPFSSMAQEVSGDGSVVVGFGNSSSGQEAFRWTAGGGMVGLGDLPDGGFSSNAIAASNDGSVIVGQGTTALGSQAFVWDATNNMRNLQDVLVASGLGVELTSWTLTSAQAISADGLTIAGIGTNPAGKTEAWVATIPEPSTFALAALGLLSLGMTRRRRR